jgi:hypothetical protein
LETTLLWRLLFLFNFPKGMEDKVMRRRMLSILGISLCGLACCANAKAQVVQLPTIQTFGTQATVVVPDRGGIQLGSVTRAGMSSTQRGVPFLGGRRSGIGTSVSHVGASVHATIIDLNEMDRAILHQPLPSRHLAPPLQNRHPSSLGSALEMHQHARGAAPSRW